MSETQRYSSVAVALPIVDRRRSYDFYTVALGLEPVGTAGSDGIPEPLMPRGSAPGPVLYSVSDL